MTCGRRCAAFCCERSGRGSFAGTGDPAEISHPCRQLQRARRVCGGRETICRTQIPRRCPRRARPDSAARPPCPWRSRRNFPAPTAGRAELDSDAAGAIAQMGERLLCKQEVAGSIPAGSTSRNPCKSGGFTRRRRREIGTSSRRTGHGGGIRSTPRTVRRDSSKRTQGYWGAADRPGFAIARD